MKSKIEKEIKTKIEKYVLFQISGGVGKNIMATAVVRAITKKYPERKIIVATVHTDVWINNPHVLEIVNPSAPFLYEKYVTGKDTKVFRLDPYFTNDHTYRLKHLTEIWCDLCGVAWDGLRPELYFSDRERESVEKLLNVKNDPRPIFMIQISGGAEQQNYPISWARDLPMLVAERVVHKMNSHNFRTIQLRRHDQPAISSSEYVSMSLRQSLLAVSFSSIRLFIDSVYQHVAAAFELPSTVCWIVNSPIVFGYPIHHNIIANGIKSFRHNPNAYLDEYNIIGIAEEYPFIDTNIFNPEKIVSSLAKKF